MIILTWLLTNTQLLLKIEEKAIISIISVVFITSIGISKTLKKTKTHTIPRWAKKTTKKGMSFCQVISNNDLFKPTDFNTSTNHL